MLTQEDFGQLFRFFERRRIMAELTTTCTFLRDDQEVTEQSNQCCFTGCEDLIRVEFSDNVDRIHSGAFRGCKNLTSVTAKGVSRIGNYAFSGCENLEELNLSLEKINWVGGGVFEDCVKMPKAVFDRCMCVMAMLRNSDPGYDGIIDD